MVSATYRRLLILRFLAAFADQIMLFAVPLIIYAQTKSVSLSGVAFFIEWLPRVISLPLAGSLSDRFGSRRIYLSADFIRTLACLVAFAAIHFLQCGYFFTLTLLMAISAFFYAQSYISLESMVPKIVDKTQLSQAQSRLQAIEQSAMVIGPIVGAFFVASFEPVYVLLAVSLLYAAAFIGMLLLKMPEISAKRYASKPIVSQVAADMSRAWKIIRIRKNLILLTVLSIAINLIFGVALATAAAMSTGLFARTSAEFGLLQTASGIVTVICLLAVPFFLKRISPFHLGIFSYVIVCSCALAIGSSNSFWVYALSYIAILSIGGWFNIYIRTERVLWIPKRHLGKTIGLIVFLNQLTLPLAGLLVSLTPDEAQAKTLFAILAVVALLVMLALFQQLKSSSRILAQLQQSQVPA